MATMQRRLVHKQFNSPIGLYSDRNVQETLDRELKQLSNGAMGIDFDDPTTTKPANLVKSAVLQALEDEERQKKKNMGLKRVAWPPSQDGDSHEEQQSVSPQYQPQERIIPVQQAGPIKPAYQNGSSPYHHYAPKSPIHQLNQPSYQSPTQIATSPQTHYSCGGSPYSSCTLAYSGAKSVSPQYQTNQYSPLSPSTNYSGQSPLNWTHVSSPVPIHSSGIHHHPPQQQYTPPPFKLEKNPHYIGAYQQTPYQPQTTQAFQPPSNTQQLGFVTSFRKEPPISQKPAPIYTSQPVAAIYQGGSNMRGDDKWPPAEQKQQSDAENEARKRLAQAPAFRPRRQQKDYSEFFAKNAVINTYPGYRAPPGTQHHGPSTPM